MWSIRVTWRRQTRATAEGSALREPHTAIEVLREENRPLERRVASADELRLTVRRLEVEVKVARAERKAWRVSPFFRFHISGVYLMGVSRLRSTAPETPAAIPILITHSLSAVRLEHAHLLKEHEAPRAALRQLEAELADTQACEVDAHATADALLGLRRTVRRGPSALLPSLSERSDS